MNGSSIIPERASGYLDTGAQILNSEIVHETTMHAAGALYSTVEDLYRWDRALYGEGLLRQKTIQQMFTPVWEQYAYGWEIHQVHERRYISHGGGLPGYVCNIMRFVDEDAVIIILSNLGSAAFAEMGDSLAAILFGVPYQLPSKRAYVKVDPAVLADYLGEYELTYFGRKSVLRFTVEGDHMMMHVQGLPTSVVSAFSDTEFYTRSKGEVELTFMRDGAGKVNSIEVNWSGNLLEAKRLK